MTERENGPPPGSYPVVVVGSGPGGLQVSYLLNQLEINHAVLTGDDRPGGMFLHFPLSDRLLTKSMKHSPAQRGSRAYEWYDWNTLLAQPEHRVEVADYLDEGTIFPTRPQIENVFAAFAGRAALPIRYGCSWSGTRREGSEFVLDTSHGEYRTPLVIVATGQGKPWKPKTPGIDLVPHYVEFGSPGSYAGKRVFVIGKENSGFELADALMPYARQVILAGPRPTRFTLHTHSIAGTRSRFVQPYEDHLLGGGTVTLDATVTRIERAGTGVTVHFDGVPGVSSVDVDSVIAATGFTASMGDLRQLGVTTKNRLPILTPFWESATVPGIFFAGTLSAGAHGMRKRGVPSVSAAIRGFRYNAALLVRHLASTKFGIEQERPSIRRDELASHLLSAATTAPELLHQKGYLARVVTADPVLGLADRGILPLELFLDDVGHDGVAITVEHGEGGTIHPVAYIRTRGELREAELAPHPFLDYTTAVHREPLEAALEPLRAGAN